MKARKGFVSNSSASSFIVRLNETNRHVATYDYTVTEKDYVSDKRIWGNSKEDLISNGYRVLREEHGWTILGIDQPIYKSTDSLPGRCTSISFGADLYDVVKILKEYELPEGEKLQEMIDELGVKNLLFCIESDEEMGGSLPYEIHELINNEDSLIWRGDYH